MDLDPEPAVVPQSPAQATLSVPMAIVAAGLLIAGAVFFSSGGDGTLVKAPAEDSIAAAAAPATAAALRPVDATDHILGNPAADVVVVEFSDPECPFCKRFHETMHQIMDEYGKSGKVAWVYRHFPLDQLHSKARNEANAFECAGEQGKFWEYADRIFKITPANDGLDPAELTKSAELLGLDKSVFAACLSSDKYAARVQSDSEDGLAIGVAGTPFSILITKDGKKIPINGAQPYSMIKKTISELLK